MQRRPVYRNAGFRVALGAQVNGAHAGLRVAVQAQVKDVQVQRLAAQGLGLLTLCALESGISREKCQGARGKTHV